MIDLSKEFNPVPKPPFKGKKIPKPLKRIGKKTKASLNAVIQMKKAFLEMGIVTCEIKLDGCLKNNFLSFAHIKKRRYLKEEDLLKGVLACYECHRKVEYECEKWTGKSMEIFLTNIINKRT